MSIDRRAAILQPRGHYALAVALRVSVGAALVSVSTTAGLLMWIAFGPFKIIRLRRVRRLRPASRP